jgi:hypothetical protein
MVVKRNFATGAAVVALFFCLALAVDARRARVNCADDQDGTCNLNVASIEGNTGSFLGGWVEAGSFYGKSSVHAGSSDQTVLDGWGLEATGIDVSTAYVGTVYADNLVTYGYKQFRIDHPLDPANKMLHHWSIESSELKNIYDGIATLDARGTAVVAMPNWFEALNGSFRYQLTAIGAPGANLFIAEEIANGRFKIAGGTANMKVSWQVTGIRHDAGARQRASVVEEDKPASDRGKYLDPAAFGQPDSMALRHGGVPRPATAPVSKSK